MLKIHEIREIIRLIDQSTISELEIEGDGTRLSLKKKWAGKCSSVNILCYGTTSRHYAVGSICGGTCSE